MPKYEIRHSAGEPAGQELRELLEHFFSRSDIERLERLGGRVLISLTTPFNPQENQAKKDIELNEKFVEQLRAVRDKPEELKKAIGTLSLKQLRYLGQLVGHPLRTKSTRSEMASELAKYFHDEETWHRIANQLPR